MTPEAHPIGDPEIIGYAEQRFPSLASRIRISRDLVP